MLLSPGLAYAELYFSPAMVGGGDEPVADLSRFNHEGIQPAGKYTVDIYVNDEFKTEKEINFVGLSQNSETEKKVAQTIHDNTGLLACLSPEMLESLGIAAQSLQRLKKHRQDCVSLGTALLNKSNLC